MSERTYILSIPQNFVRERDTKPKGMGAKLLSRINEQYDALIDVLFKWTN